MDDMDEKIKGLESEIRYNRLSILFSFLLFIMNASLFKYVRFGQEVILISMFGLLVYIVSNILVLRINKKLLSLYRGRNTEK